MMESSNNVVSLEDFKKKKEAPRGKPSAQLRQFVEAYHEAGPEATDMFNKAMMLYKAYGFDTDYFDQRDVLLLREALFSIILRYRDAHHPLHTFADEFNKYFNRLEYFLDTEWSQADDQSEEEDDNR